MDAGNPHEPEVDFSPRWVVTGQDEVEVLARYDTGSRFFHYRYRRLPKDGMEFRVTGNACRIQAHILLPETWGRNPGSV